MTLDSDRQLGEVTFNGTPHLVLGRRRGRRDMEAVRVVLHEDLHESLWELCVNALGRTQTGRVRSYEPNAELELGEEYFLLDLDEIPEQPQSSSSTRGASQAIEDGNQDRTAALLRVLRDVGVLEILDPRQLPGFATVLFYSIAWQQPDDSWVHFIRKANPRLIFKPGLNWLGFGDTLKKIADPAMVIDDLVDMILTADHLAAFSGQHLKTLFTDVHIVLRDVPKYVETVANILDSESIGITDDAKSALLAAAKDRVSFAGRLYRLQERLLEIKLDLENLGRILDLHTIDIEDLVDDQGRLHFDKQQAELFLDVLDGRLFKDDWTGELRRADRYSRRTQALDS